MADQIEIGTPFRIDSLGSVGTITGLVASVRSHIVAIITTRLGERVMRPTYGSDVHSLVFDVADPVIAAQVSDDLREVLEREEPNADIISVTPRIAESPGDTGVVITVAFSIQPYAQQFEATALVDPTLAEEVL